MTKRSDRTIGEVLKQNNEFATEIKDLTKENGFLLDDASELEDELIEALSYNRKIGFIAGLSLALNTYFLIACIL